MDLSGKCILPTVRRTASSLSPRYQAQTRIHGGSHTYTLTWERQNTATIAPIKNQKLLIHFSTDLDQWRKRWFTSSKFILPVQSRKKSTSWRPFSYWTNEQHAPYYAPAAFCLSVMTCLWQMWPVYPATLREIFGRDAFSSATTYKIKIPIS